MAKKQQEQPIKINSFFAGIGGFDLGFERQGFRTMMLCENDPFCNRILNRHWPDVQKKLDIRNVAAEDIPEAPVWCGGFPCQDISVARGKNERLGLQGERSGLFYDYARLIEQCHPEVVMIENVEGLFSSNQGRDFGIILQCMTEMGYAVAWRKINSRYFGVPQSRKRTYVCCWRNSMAKAVRVMFDNEGAPKVHNERLGFITEASEPGAYPKVPLVSYCISATTGRHTGTDWSRTYVVCHNGVRRMTPIECERLQGFPDNWTLPNIEEVQEDINSSRYKTLGNAVSVPVIEWIASRIRTELNPLMAQLCAKTMPYRGLGSGITRAMKSGARIDLCNDIDSDRFIATIWRDKNYTETTQTSSPFTQKEGSTTQNSETTTQKEQSTTQKILELIRKNPTVKIQDIASAVSLTRDGVNYQIRQLKQQGKLRRVGGDNGGHWEIIEQ